MTDDSQRTAPLAVSPAGHLASLRTALASDSSWLGRLAVNQLTTKTWTLERDLEELCGLGIPALGVWANKLDDEQQDVRMIRASGLAVSSLSWIGGFTCGEWERLEHVLQRGEELIRLGAALRAETINVITGPKGGHIRSHAKRLVVDGLRELADHAMRWNVLLSLQPMHRVCKRQWSFLHSLEESMEILDRVGRPNIRITLSSFHLSRSRSLFGRIHEFVDWIRLVQLCDGPRRPRNDHHRQMLGEGELPIHELVATLEEAGYRGRYEVELMSPSVWNTDANLLLLTIRDRFLALQPMMASKP